MLPHIRRTIIIIVAVGLVGALVLLVRSGVGLVSIPHDRTDALTVGLYLLTTIAQALSALLGMAIAVIFISAQFGPHSQLVRSGIEIFKDRTALGILTFFVVAIVLSLVSLARIDTIISDSPWVLELNLLLAIGAVVLVVPLVLSQIENLNPYHLAVKLSEMITPARIANYGLVQTTTAGSTSLCDYRLRVWGHQHGRDDPLGAFHEIVMTAVAKRDRLQIATFMRLLLNRVARMTGAPFSITVVYPTAPPTRTRQLLWCAIRIVRRPLRPPDRISATLHILHYYIRRCQNLRREWGDLDGVRQQFQLDLRDLIEALARSTGNAVCIEVALFAALHISLGYASVARFGEDEALLQYVDLVSVLRGAGYEREARLCVDVLGVIAAATTHLPMSLLSHVRAKLGDEDQAVFKYATLYTLLTWNEGPGAHDPWRNRVSSYKLPGRD
ncbi:MAG: hypothetical protein ACSLFQ_23910 [Thermoanaerobaculia bacterium]